MKCENFLDAEKILLQCFDYPEFAIPNFLEKEQNKSSWSKSVFFSALEEICEGYEIEITIGRSAAKINKSYTSDLVNKLLALSRNNNFIASSDSLEKPLDDFQKAEKIIEKLRTTIEKAWIWGTPKAEYTPIEIIGIVESGIKFINLEYIKQLEPGAKAFRSRPRDFTGKTSNGEQQFLINQFSIIGDAPVFDFIKYKTAIRNALMYSSNPDQLKIIIKATSEIAAHNVELWNTRLSTLEESLYAQNEGVNHKDKKVWKINAQFKFDSDLLRFTYTNQVSQDKETERGYVNEDLAIYSSNVAKLLSDEVMGFKKKLKEVKSVKSSASSDLFGIWAEEKNHYDSILQWLKENNIEEEPFVDDENKWLRDGTYMRAFIECCIEKKYIKNTKALERLNIEDLKRRLKKTFQFNSADAFRNDNSKPKIKDFHYRAFLNMP